MGKTTRIRKMLGYEEEAISKYTPNSPERFSLENKNFNILERWERGLIVRYYLRKNCSKCKEILKIEKEIRKKRKRLEEREREFKEAERLRKISKRMVEKIKGLTEKIKGLTEKMVRIKGESNIDFDYPDYTYEELKENRWYEYYDLGKEIEKRNKERESIESEKGILENEIRGLKDRRGYTRLKESYEFREYQIYERLKTHSREHNIDLYITILNKDDLIWYFMKISDMTINRLFLEKLIDFWLIAELEEGFEHYVSLKPPIKARLHFPQNINEIYVETNSGDEVLIIESEVVEIKGGSV